MPIDLGDGVGLLPDDEPPQQLVPDDPPWFKTTLAWHYRERPDLRRVILWSAAIQYVFESQPRWHWVPGYRFVAYGFAHRAVEANAFAVLIYADSTFLRPTEFRATTIEVTLEAPTGIIDEITVGDLQVPVIVRRPLFMPHASPLEHPHGGIAACWAGPVCDPRPRPTEVPPPGAVTGFLTAAHALRGPEGSPVTIGDDVSTTTGIGKVLAIGPPGIDAALVQPPPAAAIDPGPWVHPRRVFAQGEEVEVVCASRPFRAIISAVQDTRGMLSSNIPCNFFLNAGGLPGDSGALVRTVADNEWIGLYRGGLALPYSKVEGVCAHLAQAADAMKLLLYS
jgi:hypothetical protein